MRANTDRSKAFAFGDLVEPYDAGRPRWSGAFVRQVADRCGLDADGAVLEVGAGTGQLTDALLDDGRPVTALEPSTPLADRLRSRHQHEIDSGRLSVCTQPFEEFTDADRYGSIWSVDAWQWIDPDVAYELSARLLCPGACLIASWTLSGVVDDIAVADRLNQIYARLSPDLIRNPRQPIDESSTRAGREQINQSGAMAVADHWTEHTTAWLTAAQYADWQLSFAHIAAMSPQQRGQLRQAILQALQAFGSGTAIPCALDRYIVVARPARPSKH